MALSFSDITLERQHDYLDRLKQCPVKASDYSFLNVWGWADEYGLQWAWSDRLVWIRQENGGKAFWPPVGDWENIDWHRAFEDSGLSRTEFIRVPETLLDLWKKSSSLKVTAEQTRDQWDYLYDMTELIELSGNRFHKKKNLFNQFVKKYDYEYLFFGKDMIDQILSMQSEWCQWKDCEIQDALAAENRVIEKVLGAWDKLRNICGGAIRVEDQIVAYTLGEGVSNEELLIHYEKGNTSYVGSYQAINQLFLSHARKESKKNFERVNRMQDLGDKGLRKAKQSYNPIGFIKKYKVQVELD